MPSLKGALLASTGTQDRRPRSYGGGARRKKRKRKRKGPLYAALVDAATK